MMGPYYRGNSDSTGLYGSSSSFGGTYFEWFIFQQSATAPATPTGGSWSFTTNVGTPPAGWSSTPPASPTNTVWISIALVNSRNANVLTWSVPGQFARVVGTVTSVAATAPSFLSVTGSPITSSGTLEIGYSGTALPAENGGTGLTTPGASGNVLTSNGTGWTSAAASGISLSANNTWTGTQTFSGASNRLAEVLTNAAEVCTIVTDFLSGTVNFNVTTQSVIYYPTGTLSNWTINFRGSVSSSLNSVLSTGQSITLAFLAKQGPIPRFNNVVQIDGVTVVPKWQGGIVPSSGNADCIDVYVYTIIKTAASTFTVFASQTKFL